MAGNLDIYDRRSLTKVISIDASNTSFCEWSPDGRFILTATLSPRLRVDNGIKIWHCSGPLVHIQHVEELYQASWRPTLVDACPPFPQAIPACPAPSASVIQHVAVAKPTPVKAATAYRPPGARGSEASLVYKRGENTPTPSGGNTPNGRYSRSPAPGRPTAANGRRHVPGAPTSPSPVRNADTDKPRGRKAKNKKGPKEGVTSGEASPRPSLEVQVVNGNGIQSPPLITNESSSVPPTPGADGLDAVAKKVRNLSKKVMNSSLLLSRDKTLITRASLLPPAAEGD